MNHKAELPRLNGNALKIIACIIMLIDHIGAAVIYPLTDAGILPINMSFGQLNAIYRIIRAIGRSAFPIFCFLLVEGFIHTHSRVKYALSLLIFGIISELPYDYSMSGGINHLSNNVFFTLFIGLLVISAIEFINNYAVKKELHFIIAPLLSGCITVIGALIAYYFNLDYSYRGVALIAVFYLFRFYTPYNLVIGYLIFLLGENGILSFPAFLLMYLYNRKRGKKLGRLKYLFYIFYPAHLLLLYGIQLYLIDKLSQNL